MESEQAENEKKTELTKLYHRIYLKLSKGNRKHVIESYRKHYGDVLSDGVLYASELTGLHPDLLSHLKNAEEMKIKIEEVDRSEILRELTNFYLLRRKMPTTREMFDALQGILPIYMDISSFRKQLALMDFMWKNVKNRFYVIERPEVTYERYKFLKCILQYYESNKPIYFIDELIYAEKNDNTPPMGHSSHTVCQSSDPVNVIYALSKTSALYKSVADFNHREFRNFLCDVLLPNLKEDTLVVLKNVKFANETTGSNPTSESTAADMKEWLDRSNIPFSDDMSKAELYSLIKKCTNVDQNMYVADNILKANGHHVIRLPNHIKMLTPTTLFFDLVQDTFAQVHDVKAAPHKIVFQIFNTIDVQQLVQFHESVMNAYMELYKNDVKVDQVLDSVIENTAVTVTVDGEEDSDIPTDSDE